MRICNPAPRIYLLESADFQPGLPTLGAPSSIALSSNQMRIGTKGFSPTTETSRLLKNHNQHAINRCFIKIQINELIWIKPLVIKISSYTLQAATVCLSFHPWEGPQAYPRLRLPTQRVNAMNKPGFWGNYDEKIVCNELRRQGLMSVTDWIHDANYCARRFDSTTYHGYCLWALPCLRMMRKHPALARSLSVLVRWMAADIQYQHGARQRPHLPGFLVHRMIFWPGNRLLGHSARRLGASGRRMSRLVQHIRSIAISRVGTSIHTYFLQGNYK